jgi:hypothetical protein
MDKRIKYQWMESKVGNYTCHTIAAGDGVIYVECSGDVCTLRIVSPAPDYTYVELLKGVSMAQAKSVGVSLVKQIRKVLGDNR